MDQAPQENPPKDFNKIDLSQLQGFSFGTQWTQDKTAPGGRSRDDRPRRDGGGGGDRRDDRGGAAPRDRRAFRRPASDAPGGDAPAQAPDSGDRGGRESGPGEFRRGPRRDSGPGEFRGARGPGGGGRQGMGGGQRQGAPIDRGPYDSPYFSATFYPEDTSFAALAKTIRSSCRTFELFEIARTVIGKADRFVVVLQRKPAGGTGEQAAAQKPAPVFLSVPDGVPFETEEAAIAHVLDKHIGTFFDAADVEVEAPKGSFQVVNRCGVTGELLGPPNYHRYTQTVQRHHAAKVARMPFEAYRARIETVRDPELINQWLEKMKRTTRYTWKTGAKPAAAKPAPAAADAPAEAQPEAPVSAAPGATEPPVPAVPVPAAAEVPPAEKPAETAAATPPAEAPASFDSIEDARAHLLSRARDRVVRAVDHARFHGKMIESLPDGEIRRAVEGTLERQRRFPLDTANALRGRLRREGFTIFKKGSKGVSYVCAVKRKFRTPGQVFSESITALIAFIEANPMCKASDLPTKFMGLVPSTPPAAAAPEGADKDRPAPQPVFSPEDRAKVSRLQADLAWLVHEGYVTEFIDGRLFAPPAMVEARKKEIESGELDPENFPEAAEKPAPPQAEAPVSGANPSDSPPADPAPSAGSPEAAVEQENQPPAQT